MTFSPGTVLSEVFRLEEGLVGKDLNALSLEGEQGFNSCKTEAPPFALCVSAAGRAEASACPALENTLLLL